MNTFANICLAVAALGLVAGCDDPGINERISSSGFKSTLAPSTELRRFSPEERQRFHTERAAWEREQTAADLPGACRSLAWSDVKVSVHGADEAGVARAKQIYQHRYDNCMSDESLVVALPAVGGAGYPDGCAATVQEAEACSTELMAQQKAADAEAPEYSEITVADLAEEASTEATAVDIGQYSDGPPARGDVAEATSADFALGPACTTVLAKCPAYFDAE